MKRHVLMLTERMHLGPQAAGDLFGEFTCSEILPGLVDQEWIFRALGKPTYLRALKTGALRPVEDGER